MRRSDGVIYRKIAVAVLLSGYGLWNLFFIIKGEIPPSIFKHFTGLPCPTTGGTRSFLCLCRGDWSNFFLYNPFTLFFIALMIVSAIVIVRRFLQKMPLRFPKWLAVSWLSILAAAWITKFILPSTYW